MNGGIGTMLWFPGWSMDHTIFDPLREQLPEWGHCTIQFDKADAPMRFHELAEAAIRSVREETRGPLVLAGWSLGGLIALRRAVACGASGLILFGTTARFVRSKEESALGWPAAYLRQMIVALKRDRAAAEHQFRKILFTDGERKRGFDKLLPPAGKWSGEALSAGLELLRMEDGRAQLPNIACPTLIIHGKSDIVCPYGAAEELHNGLADSTLLDLELCGHVPFINREQVLALAIRRWWNGQQDSSSV